MARKRSQADVEIQRVSMNMLLKVLEKSEAERLAKADAWKKSSVAATLIETVTAKN